MDVAVLLQECPIKPADLVILAVGVVVAVLRPPGFVSHQYHRYTQRQQVEGEKILDLAHPQPFHLWIVRRSLNTTIPAQVVVCAIPVVLFICLVVLLVIRNQVVQREAIMRGYEVNALLRLPVLMPVQVGAGQETVRHLDNCVGVAFKETAYVIPELTVPLLPAVPDEGPYLVEPTCIPCFRD